MRRLLALTMILSLLSVTSMPVQAGEPMCESAIEQSSRCAGCDTPAAHQPAQASAERLGGHARIECGCGCHRDIDGLPHVLDACSPAYAGLDVAVLSQHAPWITVHPLSLQVYHLQRPPPRTLS